MTDTALLIIDVQEGMFAKNDPVYQGDELLTKIASLLTKARQTQTPIIYIQHGSPKKGHLMEIGTPSWKIHPAIAPQEGELIVHKQVPDAFHGTNLQQELAERNIKKLVLAGIQSDCCVDTTCRRAFSLDYDVTLVEDAHSTWADDTLTAAQIIAHHNASLSSWFATLQKEQDITFSEAASTTT